MFNVQLFKEYLVTDWLGHSLEYFQELDSTNNYAKKLTVEPSLHGKLILTDEQNHGRGQYARSWDSAPGQNLTFSLIFTPPHSNALTSLTLALALAVSDVVSDFIKKDCELKWPNDVYCGGKKIAGLLTESTFYGSEISKLIIGIGLNVNQIEFPEELSDAASLYTLSDTETERERLLSRLLSKMEYYYRLWETRNNSLFQLINKKLIGYGKWVRITVNNELKEGEYKFLGINENGTMIVLNKQLEVDTFAYEQIRIHVD